MNTEIRSSLEEIVELTLTKEEYRTLWIRFYTGHWLLKGVLPRPGEVDEVGQPILTRRAWGKDDAYREKEARIGEAINSLHQRGHSDEHVLRGSRDAMDYMGSCVWMSLVLEDDMTSQDIFATDPKDHEGIAIHKRLALASTGSGPSADAVPG